MLETNGTGHVVMIVAPLGQDAAAMAALLQSYNIATHIYSTLSHCAESISELSAALLLTEEALDREQIATLLQALEQQPNWSELPLIVLVGSGESRQATLRQVIAAAPGSVTVLERPLHAATLVHAVQVALRSRARQYQVRDLLQQQRLHAHERANRAAELERALSKRTEEVTQAERRLATADRMAAVGTLASGLAHDMQNVLLPLSARLDMLLTHMSVDGATHDHLVAVQGLLNHLREMAKNLAMFSRDPEQEGLIGQTDLVHWSSQTWRFIEAAIRTPHSGAHSITLGCDVPKDLPQVAIAPHRLTQIVLNLFLNARDAILTKRSQQLNGDGVPPAGRIELNARVNREIQQATMKCNGAIVLKVIDDGIGMDRETARRSIEPFFTTKARPEYPGGSGSGQGLALVHGIVDRVGGVLDINSELGKGTTVTLTLPVVEGV